MITIKKQNTNHCEPNIFHSETKMGLSHTEHAHIVAYYIIHL